VILVVDMNCKKNSLGYYEFVLPIISIISEIDECKAKHFMDLRSKDTRQCDGMILSGTPLKDNTTLSQLDKFEWIKTWDKPLLGICAGMQTIGLAFGSRLKRCAGIGMTQINTTKENPLFSSQFKAYTLHNFSIIPSGKFDVLAESTQCVQAIRHKQRDVYGVLFHPEVRNKEIIQRFIHAFNDHRRV